MAEQTDHLIGATGWPNVVIQVIPAATAVHDGVNGGGFAIADFEGGPGLGCPLLKKRRRHGVQPRDVAQGQLAGPTAAAPSKLPLASRASSRSATGGSRA